MLCFMPRIFTIKRAVAIVRENQILQHLVRHYHARRPVKDMSSARNRDYHRFARLDPAELKITEVIGHRVHEVAVLVGHRYLARLMPRPLASSTRPVIMMPEDVGESSSTRWCKCCYRTFSTRPWLAKIALPLTDITVNSTVLFASITVSAFVENGRSNIPVVTPS